VRNFWPGLSPQARPFVRIKRRKNRNLEHSSEHRQNASEGRKEVSAEGPQRSRSHRCLRRLERRNKATRGYCSQEETDVCRDTSEDFESAKGKVGQELNRNWHAKPGPLPRRGRTGPWRTTGIHEKKTMNQESKREGTMNFRKTAREAAIFMLLGPVVAAPAVFAFFQHRNVEDVKTEAARGVYAIDAVQEPAGFTPVNSVLVPLTNGVKLYVADCSQAAYLNPTNMLEFSSHAEAVDVGKKPCKTCRA